MIPGLDSKPPTNAQIAAAKVAGYRVWALYHGTPGDGIDPGHLASDDDFRRVLAGGMGTFAYVSGAQNPAAIKAWSQATGIRAAVDCERGIREDGPWVPGWLAASGAGLYGNGSVHYDANGFRRAAFHVFAGYYGYDPGSTWPGWLPHDSTPTGWQWKGTTSLFGTAVDLNWFDDAFAQLHGAAGGSLGTEEEMDLIRNQETGAIATYGFAGKRTIGQIEWEKLGSPPPNGRGLGYENWNGAQFDAVPDVSGSLTLSAADEKLLKEAHESIASLVASEATDGAAADALTAEQAQQLKEAHDAVLKLTVAGTLTPMQDQNLQTAKDAILAIEGALKGA